MSLRALSCQVYLVSLPLTASQNNAHINTPVCNYAPPPCNATDTCQAAREPPAEGRFAMKTPGPANCWKQLPACVGAVAVDTRGRLLSGSSDPAAFPEACARTMAAETGTPSEGGNVRICVALVGPSLGTSFLLSLAAHAFVSATARKCCVCACTLCEHGAGSAPSVPKRAVNLACQHACSCLPFWLSCISKHQHAQRHELAVVHGAGTSQQRRAFASPAVFEHVPHILKSGPRCSLLQSVEGRLDIRPHPVCAVGLDAAV